MNPLRAPKGSNSAPATRVPRSPAQRITPAQRSDPPPGAAPTIVALVGNPNAGKTALFNALTGFRRHVANYPGVTVDVARGPIRDSARPMEVLDLPGSYSLAAASPDEVMLLDAVAGRIPGQPRPAIILAIVDASNLARNFYLVSQIVELGLPVVLALNMIDIARARGIEVDVARLSERLGIPVVPIIATQPSTIEPVVRALETATAAPPVSARAKLPAALVAEATAICDAAGGSLTMAEALRVLADRGGHAERRFLAAGGEAGVLEQARERMKALLDGPVAPAEIRARYAWVDEVLAGVLTRTLLPGDTWSNRVDRVLTHRVGGGLALLAVLYTVFYAIYRGATPIMDVVDATFRWLGSGLATVLPAGVVRSVVTDGLIGGVGGVLAFLPQILILFLFIALLEDCGYLARAAFMVDRLLRPLGLSGRAFIPLLSAFACGVPAILGTRAIADRRERLITILMIPFMSCSARLPVYVLMTGALVRDRAWLGGWLRLDAAVMLSVYLVGVVCAILIALLLRKTVLAGPAAGFLLELPSYKLPRVRTVFQRMYLAGRSFVVRAGTVILVVNLIVWALGYFPHASTTRQAVAAQHAAEGWDNPRYESELAGAYLRDSFLGRLGHTIEPALKPLGWDWRIGVGVLASFPAREVVIATLGTVFNLEQGAAAESTSLRDAVRQKTWEGSNRPLFTLPVALSIMVFFALCAQCASTLVVIGKETGSRVWPVVSFFGMTTMAYAAAWAVFNGARALGV